MNGRNDLTRWNRASLTRFRYIDGNAATFLEELRQALLERFSDPATETVQWEDLVPRKTGDPDDAYVRLEKERKLLLQESDRERIDRLLAQYQGERRDLAWEIARVLARSCHVLTEHLDAYANEGYLGTATQWENVRRLVEMLDYHPAPPASASTQLVVEAKDEAAGTLAVGFQVKYSPPDGGAPVVFETLADLDIDAGLNQLRPADYDRSQQGLNGELLLLENTVEDLNIGDPLVLEDEKTGVLRGHRIQGLQVKGGSTQIRLSPAISPPMLKGYAKVHLKPKERLAPTGPVVKEAQVDRVLHLTVAPEGLSPGTVLYISDGIKAYYRRVDSIRGKRLTLKTDVGALRLDEARVGPPVQIEVTDLSRLPFVPDQEDIYRFRTAGDWSNLAGKIVTKDIRGEKSPPVYTVTDATYRPVVDGADADEGFTTLTVAWNKKQHDVPLENTRKLLVPPTVPGPWEVDSCLEKVNGHLPGTLTASLPKKTGAGDMAVVDNGSHIAWARLGAVTIDEESQESSLVAEDAWLDRNGGDFFLTETTIFTNFKETLRLQEWQVNSQPLTGKRVPLSTIPAALKKGRTVMVENADDASAAFVATVATIDVTKNPAELVLDRDLPPGFTYGNTLLAANVVAAGHGEIKGEKVLGSGDATRSSQTFQHNEKNVSFVADAAQTSGVRGAIELNVAGRIWQQVSSFQNSRPTDFHYTVRMTEDGTLKITFGDGKRGRRLPTGANNIRVTCRKGSGLSGNLAAGSFTKPARPHPLVDTVRQPLPATGGNDMEGVESLRNNAPATLLTLERAVSLDDFTYLAMSQSSVWQAGAFSRPVGLGRKQIIEVVVVPAGGGELGGLALTLTDFLLSHAVPGIEVAVVPYRSATFDLEVTLTVNTAEYNPEDVAAAVGTSLAEAFSLINRGLGQDLFLSEVYKVVEGVTGVDHSVAVIDGDKSVQRKIAADQEVLILGSLLVDYVGSGTSQAALPPTLADSEPETLHLVGRRPVSILQGVGSRYAGVLQGRGIQTLDSLRTLAAEELPGISQVRLAEFRTKAELVVSLDIDKTLVAPLLESSLLHLLQSSSEALADESGLSRDVIEGLKGKLRVLQIALDEESLPTMSLWEVLTEVSS